MRVQSAICAAVTTITTTITVAAGVFAPGHLGELTWQVPFELADAVLEETRTAQQRLRVLPSRVGIYFVLALGLFPAPGYGGVWAKLTLRWRACRWRARRARRCGTCAAASARRR